MQNLIESVGCVWIVWLTSVAVFVAATRWLLGRRSPHLLRAVHRDESGAVYVLSVVMILPFYVLLICVIIETTLMLVAKMGTTYAAFCAARAAIVWDVADSSSTAKSQSRAGLAPNQEPSEMPVSSQTQQKASDAAVIAMTPFASGSPIHIGAADKSTGDNSAADQAYVSAFRKAAPHSRVSLNYLAQKARYAQSATTVEIAPKKSNSPAGELEAAVTYRYPFHLPVVGRLFGAARSQSGGAFLVYEIRSNCVLPSEAPRNPDRSLGIEYRPE